MKTNPGGQLAPSEVIGRDTLIGQLWRVLERQSLVLTAERRMGKTSVIKKMEAEAPASFLPVYHDLEGIRTPLEFAELVLDDVNAYLSTKSKIASRTRKFFAEVAGTEVGDLIKMPDRAAAQWKKLLKTVIEDLAEHQDRTLVFFWDEVPLMLHNIKQRESEQTAMEVLDVLRELRQTHKGLRMVFTGSIGLHNVVTGLKEMGYANAPLNDMRTVNVEPLSPEYAQQLAFSLLQGEQIEVDSMDHTARTIAAAVDCVPFYIHYIIDEMKTANQPVDSDRVKQVVTDCLTDPMDGWQMAHYRERIDTYYTRPQQRTLALALLDVLAEEERLPFEQLYNRLKSRMPLTDADKERVRKMLTLLQRDHYIMFEEDNYCFRFLLVRRWWHMHRG